MNMRTVRFGVDADTYEAKFSRCGGPAPIGIRCG